jgi:endonuclease YncB( thermonuclease family)
VDWDRYGRLVGKVWLDGRDVNKELVVEGHAWVYRKYMLDATLLDDEVSARAAGRGLWFLPEAEWTPPWEWRRR